MIDISRRESRDPVDIAELKRDYEETHGTELERNLERQNYEANQADLEHCTFNEENNSYD